jgi:hypothetical protein
VRAALSLFAFTALLAVIVAAYLPTNAAPTQSPFPSPSPIPSVSLIPQTNPFPSPSPTPRSAIGNGFVTAGYLWGSAGGGVIEPLPGSTATAEPFPASASESGFWLDAAGRLGPSYLAALSYENYGIFGGDHPYLSYAQLSGLYEPSASHWAFGLGFISAQRSTANANMDSLGVGLTLMPNLSTHVSPYVWAFLYPDMRTGGTSSSLFSGQAGVAFTPRLASGLFLRLGVETHCCFPPATSPKSDFGTTVGLGTFF